MNYVHENAIFFALCGVIQERMVELEDKIDPVIQFGPDGTPEDDQNASRHYAVAAIARRVIQFLTAEKIVALMSTGSSSAALADDRLRDPLRAGFEEGRNPAPPAQAPTDSATSPEKYEQLQLPGMEDY